MSSKKAKGSRTKLQSTTYDSFNEQSHDGQVNALYLFFGEEVYLQEMALRALCETIDESCRVFNVSVFAIGADSGGDSRTTAAEAIATANQLPMMAGRRIVIIRDFDKIKEEELELVADYLKRPSLMTTVIFQAVSFDQRRKISALLKKYCTSVAFEPLNDREAKHWAQDYLNKSGTRIDSRALERLIRLAGTGLSRLVNELNKLSAYTRGATITEEAVLELVARSREHTNWELWDAIIARDSNRSLRLIKRLLDDGGTGAPLMVLGALAGLYRRMLLGKEALERGARLDEFARTVGQWESTAGRWQTRLRTTSRAEIVHGIQRIAEVDNAIKNAEATPRLQMEYLVAELVLPRSDQRQAAGT